MTLIVPKGRFTGAEVIDRDREHLEPEELKRLFDVLHGDPFWFGYFRVQYFFGMRVSEVALILKEDVSYHTKEILIRRLKKPQVRKKTVTVTDVDTGKSKTMKVDDHSAGRGSGFQEYVYTMPDHLIAVLRKVPNGPNENPWFFPSPSRPVPADAPEAKERMANIRRTVGGWRAMGRSSADTHFRDAALEAGVPSRLAHTHVLRHTRATLMLADGAPEEQVRWLLGHSSVTTTRGYIGIARSLRLRLHTGSELGLGDLK